LLSGHGWGGRTSPLGGGSNGADYGPPKVAAQFLGVNWLSWSEWIRLLSVGFLRRRRVQDDLDRLSALR